MTDSLKPNEIKDQPVPLISGGLSNASGNDTIGADEFVQNPIPDVVIPRGIVASQVISESIDTQAREIKGSYIFGQVGALQIGTSTNGIKISPTGFVATKAGVATVTITSSGDATFVGTVGAGSIVTGYLTVGSAASDVNSGSTTISGGKITTGSITASQIQAHSITATEMNVGSLSAISANLGTITAGVINGVTIQLPNESLGTGSSGKLIWASNARIWGDSSGNIGIHGQGGQVIIYGNGSTLLTLSNSGQANMPNGIHLTSGGSNSGNLNVDGDARVNGRLTLNSNTMTFGDSSGSLNFSITNLGLSSSQEGGGNAKLTWGSGQSFKIAPGSGNTFSINGNSAKTAIVPTSKGYNALYCMESPEVWFMDFCGGKKKLLTFNTWKFWEWKYEYVAYPDEMFIETTVAPYIIMPTAVKGLVQVWGHRKGHEAKRFESKTFEEFQKNEEFLNMAKVNK